VCQDGSSTDIGEIYEFIRKNVPRLDEFRTLVTFSAYSPRLPDKGTEFFSTSLCDIQGPGVLQEFRRWWLVQVGRLRASAVDHGSGDDDDEGLNSDVNQLQIGSQV
jgi:hypothetical protein